MIKLPKKLSNEENAELVRLIQETNDHQAKDKFIRHHARLAMSIGSSLARKLHVERDEMQSVTLLALVEAVNDIYNLDHTNISGFLIVCMQGACYEYLRQRNRSVEAGPLNVNDVIAPGDLVDMWDMLHFLAQTEEEHEILRLRAEGYNNKEISKELQITPHSVGRTLHKLFARKVSLDELDR